MTNVFKSHCTSWCIHVEYNFKAAIMNFASENEHKNLHISCDNLNFFFFFVNINKCLSTPRQS